jgi:hypothetical protein
VIKSRLAALLGVTILAGTMFVDSAGAQQGPSNEELSHRINTLEAKVDALIEMMGKKETAPVEPSSTAASAEQATVDTTDLVPGLFLDLYRLPFSEKIDLASIGTALVSEPFTTSGAFEYAAFQRIAPMAQYVSDSDRQIALNWTGYLKVKDEGEYVLQTEILKDGYSRAFDCVVALQLDGQAILGTKVTVQTNKSDDLASDQTSNQRRVGLEQGLHKFSLWTYCSGRNPSFKNVHFPLKMKGPKDRALKEVSADSFLRENG